MVWLAMSCGDNVDPPVQPDPCPALGDACDPMPGDAPALSPPVTVVPSSTMIEGVVSQTSHNNLDVIWHRGRLYFAFRTAPTHFASRDVVLYVVSTADQQKWTFEARIDLDTDLREPRFLAIGDRLFLYFAVLGTTSIFFEPHYAMVTEQRRLGRWTTPEPILPDLKGFIPWRTKVIAGTAYMLGYVGGENIYQGDGDVRVHWLTTRDGRTFTPAVSDQSVVLEGGSSETDLVMTDDGGLVAVSRNERGDDLGWGTKICRAAAGDLGHWTCVSDPRKYDSPLLFRHGQDIYLIGRRHLVGEGRYDLMRRDLPPEEQTILYETEYWMSPKRCALWKVDPRALSVSFVLDLPSSGDTCFPGLVELGAGRYLVYNYTSPLDGVDRSWYDGQFGPTFIYRTTLTLP